MREIKFRAWIPSRKQMLPVDIEQGRAKFGHTFFDDDIVMQYTGLKDKNGKEIYEGDIVTYYCGSDKQISPMKVAIPDIYISDNDSDGYMATHTYEVIGNIYENPELLTTKE